MLRTVAQRDALCKDCPVAKTADLIGDTQSILIVRDLLTGAKRFRDMEQSLGMSTRTLTLKLRTLESEGFIQKESTAYSLTVKGKALRSIISSLRKYGEKYL